MTISVLQIGIDPVFGDGSDGTVVWDEDDTPPTVNKYYENLTIPAGVTLDLSTGLGGIVIHVRGTLDIQGSIITTAAAIDPSNQENGGDSGIANNQGDGAQGPSAGTGDGNNGDQATLPLRTNGGSGGAGGNGGAGAAGIAGLGGAAVETILNGPHKFDGSPLGASPDSGAGFGQIGCGGGAGGAGGGDGVNFGGYGGGGGAGGYNINLFANRIIVGPSAVIRSTGGAGGSFANAVPPDELLGNVGGGGGGAGGGGGNIYLVYNYLTVDYSGGALVESVGGEGGTGWPGKGTGTTGVDGTDGGEGLVQFLNLLDGKFENPTST